MIKKPRYKALHETLKQQILDGTHKEGDLIPSENQLSKLYGINRMTVRRALDELVNEGLIAKRAGKGSIVVNTRKSLGLLSFKGFSEVIGTTTHQCKTVFLAPPQVSEWPESFFYELTPKQIRNGCIQIIRLRLVDKEAVMLEYTFIENEGLSELVSSPFIDSSLFKTLHLKHHIEVINLAQDILAIAASEEIANHLQMEAGKPLIHIYRRYHTSKTGFYIFSSLYCNTANYTIGNYF